MNNVEDLFFPISSATEGVKEICENCRHHAFIAGVSVCRRYPPTASAVPASIMSVNGHPVVAIDDTCGEFRLKSELYDNLLKKRLHDITEKRKQEEAENVKKPFHGWKPSDEDIVISGCRLICTCSVCPEQYEVFDNETGKQLAYFRLRHGHFRADVPDVGGQTVYDADTKGDGWFEDTERRAELERAIKAVKEYWAKNSAADKNG